MATHEHYGIIAVTAQDEPSPQLRDRITSVAKCQQKVEEFEENLEKEKEKLAVQKQQLQAMAAELVPVLTGVYGNRLLDKKDKLHKILREHIFRDIVWTEDEKRTYEQRTRSKIPADRDLNEKLVRKVRIFYERFLRLIFQAKEEIKEAGDEADEEPGLQVMDDEDTNLTDVSTSTKRSSVSVEEWTDMISTATPSKLPVIIKAMYKRMRDDGTIETEQEFPTKIIELLDDA